MTALHVLPQRIRAENAVLREQHIEGRLGLEHLSRLRECLAEDSAEVEATLRGVRGEDGAPRIRGTISGRLRLACQRCGGPFDWHAALAIDWRLVSSEAEEQRLLADCEPVRVEDDWLPLRSLVEDELLLALPMLPRCGCETEAGRM